MADNNPGEGLRTSCNDLVRRMVRLPASIFEGISRALSHGAPRRNPQNPQPQSPSEQPQQPEGLLIIPEEWLFLTLFEQQHGSSHPFFYACRFIEALKIAKDESKLVFVYLHSPDHPYTTPFCRNTLSSDLAVEFLDANFVSWAAVASRGEGLEMATVLKAATFPFCAVIAPASGKSIAVLQQVEGPVSPEELVEILQRTLEEQGAAFRTSTEDEEKAVRESRQLRAEQDAAYLESLQKDKEKERARQILVEGKAQEAAKRRRKANEERLRGIPVSKQPILYTKEASKEAQRKESSSTRTMEPVTKILIRFPNGTRKEQSFASTDTIRSIYEYIDSLDLPGIGSYRLISNFPRKVHGHEQLDTTLKDSGLHPNAAVFLELLQ